MTHLWRHELRRSTEGTSRLPIPHLLLTQPIVRHFHVSVKREQDVVQLEIPIDDAFGVEILECKQDLAGVELRLSESEMLLLDVEHEIASRDVLHDEVHPRLGLETGVKTKEEWMTFLSGRKEDSFLGLSAELSAWPTKLGIPFHLIIFDDKLLFQYLDRVEIATRLLFGQHDFPEVPFAQHREEIKVV